MTVEDYLSAGSVTSRAGWPVRVVCRAEWGVCPDHGKTLTDSGEVSRCRVCGRQWDYPRGGTSCEEVAAYDVADAQGGRTALCCGHALDARRRLAGAIITALEGNRCDNRCDAGCVRT